MHQALAGGLPPVRLLREVLERAQRRVGVLWERGAITVAEEHAATAVAERALMVVAGSVRRPPSGPLVTVACSEDEWHAMPARLAAEIARAGGLAVRVLGASIPADHLHRHLLAEPPAALALSTTLTANLVGAARCIDAAHRAGVPVVVGGAAWGSGTARAAALGADAKVDDPADLPEVVANLAEHEALATSRLPTHEEEHVAAAPEALVEEAWQRSARHEPDLRTGAAADAAVLELRWLLRHTAAAMVCDDLTVLTDALRASTETRGGHKAGGPVQWCRHLADVLDDREPGAADLLRRAAEAQRPGGAQQ